MEPGTMVGDRFRVEALIGAGGMGVVARATDTVDGSTVALKRMRRPSAHESARFVRESEALARLSHPAIVRHVAHGEDTEGHWLAMEWLEGEDLAVRLGRGALTATETVSLARRVADALAAAHAVGIVHRDVKPANLLLAGADPHRVKVVDFGVAHLSRTLHGDRTVTQPGVMIGTPGYLAPEQVRATSIDARADLFALGCVIFECLVGRPAFFATDVVALLAKILFEPTPRLAELCEVPDALDALVAQLLEKEPDRRPGTACEVARALGSLVDGDTLGSRAAPARRSVLTGLEMRYVAVVAAGGGELPATADTWMPEDREALRRSLGRVARRTGARVEVLVDGTIVAVLGQPAAAGEQAARAARLALILRDERPGVPIALATGRTIVTDDVVLGDALDRTIALLRRTPPDTVGIDAEAAGLVGDLFEVEPAEDGALRLRGERSTGDGSRTLLGRPSLFVGRRRELALLESSLEECVDESHPRAVLVVAEAGMGKSRLATELVAVALDRGVRVLRGRADPFRAGAPWAVAASVLRHACGGRESAPDDRSRLEAALAERVGAAEATALAPILAEVLGVADDGPSLAALRTDPALLAERVRAALVRWLAAECRRGALVVVLDDVHACDRPSADAFDEALREVQGGLLVLALARPEIEGTHPKLFAQRERLEVRLGRIGKSASERLVRDALGERVDDTRVAGIVERADGNAFFLEELVRAAAAGRDGAPDSVLGTLEARLAHLPDEARRVLRAASVLGITFRPSAVRALVGHEADVALWLSSLVADEVLVRRPSGPDDADPDHGFRHALGREASYAMLTAVDRARGHRRAADWLAALPVPDPLALADHLERAGDARAAAAWLGRASHAALEAGDLERAAAHAERGLTADPAPPVRAELAACRAEAALWLGRTGDARAAALDALAGLDERDEAWVAAIGTLLDACSVLGDRATAEPWVERLVATPHDGAPATQRWVATIVRAAAALVLLGRPAVAVRLLGLAEPVVASPAFDEPSLRARMAHARSLVGLASGDLGRAERELMAATAAFAAIGAERMATLERVNRAGILIELGAYREAAASLEDALGESVRRGWAYAVALAELNLGVARAALGALEPAIETERRAVAALHAQADARLECSARCALSEMLLAHGDGDAAAAEAALAVDVAGALQGSRASALGTLARAELGRGRTAEALAASTEGMALLGAHALEEREAGLRLVHAHALGAAGRADEARETLRAARARLEERAAAIADPVLRASFLERVADHAETIAAAAAAARA